MADENLVSQPPLTTAIIDQGGTTSKVWAIWFRDVYKRVAFKGGNAIDDNADIIDGTIDTLDEAIAQIIQNAFDIDENAAAISDHAGLTEAHGSNGAVVGKSDVATELLVGLVKQMAVVANAVQSIVEVTSTDIAAAPAAYDQTYTDTIVTLSNELKSDVNQLVTNLNSAIDQLNSLLANSKTSGQMNV